MVHARVRSTAGAGNAVRRFAAGTLALASLGATGCVRYTAPVAKDYERGDFVVHVESVGGRRIRDSHIVLRTPRVAERSTLLQARITPEPAACEEGRLAVHLGRDRAETADAPLVPGERLTLSFPEGALPVLTEAPVFLEILVRLRGGATRCLSLPLAEEDAPLTFEARERFTFGMDASIEGFTTDIGPVSQVALLPATAGVWAAGVHWSVGGGFAFAGCPERYCAAPSEDQRINYTTGYYGSAGVDVPIFERAEFLLGAAARYRILTLPATTRDGRVDQTAHGPVLAPFVGIVAAPAGPSDDMKGSRAGFMGIEIPVGYNLGDEGRNALSIGGNLRVFFTAL